MLKLKFCLINCENLFIVFNKENVDPLLNYDETQWAALQTPAYNNKPLRKTQHLAQTLISTDADIILMTEIGGLESLKNFNHYFLKDSYSPILIEGNSERHIDVGFLIKKNSSFYYDLFSHKNHELNLNYTSDKNSPTPVKYYLSRDCAELRLFTSDVNKPFAVVLLTHLKSPLDPENKDHQGSKRRLAELNACIDIYNQLSEQYSHIPILLTGDFNGNASALKTDKEFEPLYRRTRLKDICEISALPIEKRATFIQFRNGHRPEPKQIDYVFIDEKFADFLNKQWTAVVPYKDEYGFDLGFPQSLDQKLKLPSDHYALTFMLEISQKP